MTEPAIRQNPGSSFLGAPAVYYCDIAHDGKPRLRLAYVVELTLPPYYGVGLIARTQLREDELAWMDAIGRRLLTRPFDYLRQECERVRRSASPGCAIGALSASHHTALQIAPPQEIAVPPTLARTREAPTTTTILDGLSDMLRDCEDMGGPVATDICCESI